MGRELMKGYMGVREKSSLLLPLHFLYNYPILFCQSVKMLNLHACTVMQADVRSWDAETEFKYI
jgi:hypothetical protein